jgi:serine/threonine protein phosphatase 1
MTSEKNHRDEALEVTLQKALDDGHRVWVVGDVHGFHLTMEALVEQLALEPEDWVVFLGDLIDRGPDSHGVMAAVKAHPRMTSVLGNHEAMMLEQFHAKRLATNDMDVRLWWQNGGSTTVFSYEKAHRGIDGKEDDEAMYATVAHHRLWLASLPTHIVLDAWRLVHAGYDPEQELDEQSHDEYLWIRTPFHRAANPVDRQRTVVFGHTPTVSLPGHVPADWGKVWNSPVRLDDGRSAAVGIDTCLYHGQIGPKVLTAYDLRTGAVVQQERVEG